MEFNKNQLDSFLSQANTQFSGVNFTLSDVYAKFTANDGTVTQRKLVITQNVDDPELYDTDYPYELELYQVQLFVKKGGATRNYIVYAANYQLICYKPHAI